MLSQIVTGGETYPISPRNQNNCRWNREIHILPRQGHIQTNAVKAQEYGNSVLDRRGALLVDFMPQAKTICLGMDAGNGEVYTSFSTIPHTLKSSGERSVYRGG
ncbi:hypothetical protein TNCV_537431 [Trichonephila clavipes]|nr:hypothetical protein TNCV_537431 [Trichonephila clavipes]